MRLLDKAKSMIGENIMVRLIDPDSILFDVYNLEN